MIREVIEEYELRKSVSVIRESFMTVAREFNLTRENCSTNAAFIEYKDLVRMKENGAMLFGFFSGNRQAGFVAIRKATENIYFVEKLAVIPELRHRGFGRELMNFAENYVKQCKGRKISIGIINKNIMLKNWYNGMGYEDTGSESFIHLPFEVCFMVKDVK